MSDHRPNRLMNTYARMPVAFTRGEGAWLWDEDGKRYLDATSGLGVTALGHAHPAVAETICDQARTLIHTANLARVPWQETLAEKLCGVAGMDRAFICNSGTEAVECALKICRLAAHEQGIDEPEVVVMEDSFHGRTMAALSATGSKKVQAGFEPLVSGFVRVPYGDFEAVQAIAENRPNVIAVLLEPIQGESGVRVPPAGYLGQLRNLCDQQGWLLACDEIQTGLCRTGRWYDCHHEGVKPDLLTSAKALANGFPIGACMGSGRAAEAFTPGRHGSTFGGNPLACRTACTVLDLMSELKLYERAAATGKTIMEGFRARLAGNAAITDIRGRGLMIGIEADQDVNQLKNEALERGLLMNVTHDNVVRLLPPLI
ncbi:MAG: aspartate aminotransferase family protein, partial [Xanthomonadales bacterium]|nr:aspartate aminotransferase family protein [Xanthomonadales bacterium]